MANQIKYSIGFEVQQQSLNQLKSSLQQLQKMKISDIMKVNDSDFSSAQKSFDQISKRAKEVENALDKAFNAKLNTFNIQTFNQQLNKSRINLNDVYQTFSRAGATGEAAFRDLAMQVTGVNAQIKESHQILDKVAETFANSAKWHIASSAVNSVTRSIEQAWGYTKALDSSLNDIRVVTGKSADEMANFAIQANEAAKSLGKSTTDYTNAALIYAQQGLSDAEIEERAKITLKAANVTGQSTDAVSEQLTAVWNGYKVTAEEAELYVDRLAAVAATSASNLEELSTGMSKVASAAAAMGVGEDKLAAQLATIISVTKQAPESVGTALRTVYARISDIQAGLDEEGVTLGNYSGKMANMGISVLDVNGKLRDMGDVMEEIGAKWDTMTREQQVYLAQTMAGQRQYNNLLALFDNFEQYNKELAIAQGAAGTLQEQQDIYMESTAAHLKVLKASIEGIYDSLADTDTIDGLIDALSKGATLIQKLVDSLGGGIGVLSTLGALGVTVFSQQIGSGIQTSINNMQAQRQEVESLKKTLESVKGLEVIQSADSTTQNVLDNIVKVANMSGKLPTADIVELRKSLLELVETANQSSIVNERFEILQKAFLNFGTETKGLITIYGDLNSALSTSQGAEAAKKNLGEIAKAIQQIKEKEAEGVRSSLFEYLNQLDGPADKAEESFKKIKKELSDFINLIKTAEITDVGPTAFDSLPRQLQQSIEDAQNKLHQLESDSTATADSSSQKILNIVHILSNTTTQANSQLQYLMEVAQKGLLTGFQEAAQDMENKFKQHLNNMELETQRFSKIIRTQDIVNFASGIGRVAAGIQQVQNLGNIWGKTDESMGKRLLQTITSLSFSLPMLSSGLKTLGGITVKDAAAFKLFGLSVGESAVEFQLFNSVISMSPLGAFVAVVTAASAAIGIYTNFIKEAHRAQLEENKATIDNEKSIQEELDAHKELYDSIAELNQKREDGLISRAELKNGIEDLIKQYGLEGQAADQLRNNYNNLIDTIRELKKQQASRKKESAQEAYKAAKESLQVVLKDNPTFGPSVNINTAQISESTRKILSEIGGFNTESSLKGQDFITEGFQFLTKNISTDNMRIFAEQYSQIQEAVRNITDKNDRESEWFNSLKEWLALYKEQVDAYTEALKSLEEYGAEFATLSKDIDFSNIKNAQDYLNVKKEIETEIANFLKEEAEEKGYTNSQIQQRTKQLSTSFLRANATEAENKFGQIDDILNSIKEKTNKEIPDGIQDALAKLDDDQLAFLFDLDRSTLSNWELLEKAIDDISKKNLSNLKPIASVNEGAAQQYSIYNSLEQQVRNGKNISKSEYESLLPEVQEFFTITANKTYQLTGAIDDFYKKVNELKLDGFRNNVEALQTQIARLQELSEKDFDFQDIDREAYEKHTSNGHTYSTIDKDLVEKQLDYLSVFAANNQELEEEIALWRSNLQNLKTEDIQAIYNKLSEFGPELGDLEKLTEDYKQAMYALHDAMFPTDADVDESALNSLKNTIQDIADESNELANSLSDGTREATRAAEDVAEAILRFDDAITDVVDHYDEWLGALNNGSIQEQAEVIQALRDAYADLLDLDGTSLSNDFLTNAENLQLMKAAAEGSEQAYNSLMQAAQQDIATQIGLDTSQFDAGFDHLMDLYYQGQNLDDMEIGASLNNQDFLDGLTEMVRAAGMTAQQATDYLASMGVDAEVIQQNTQAEEQSEALEYKTTLTPNTQTVTNTVLSDSGGMLTPVQVEQNVTSWDQNVESSPVLGTAIKQNKSFALKVISAHKSSGGKFKFSQAANGGGSKGAARRAGSGKKGGGGKKGGSKKAAQPDTSKKDLKKEKEDQRDIYHDINIELDQLNRELERVQKEQERLYGKDLIDNLTKQVGLLEQHKELLEEKHELQQQDLKSQRETLENLGVTFDEYGNISNYLSILAQKQAEINARTKDYNNLIEAYNESTNKDMKKNIADEAAAIDKHIKQMEDEYKDLQKKIKDYDGLREDMEDLVDQIEEETQKQIELNIKKFRMELEIRLDMGEAERDWNEFRREVLEHTDVLKDTDFDKIFGDALKDARDMTSYFNVGGSIGSLEMLTNQLMNTRAQIEAINETGKSAIYGDNKAQAMEDLQNDLDELMSQMKDVEDLIDNIDEAYLDTIDDIDKQFDKQIDDYEYVNELIEHNIDLLGLLYGDKNYEAMQKYYATLERNNLKQLDSLKQQRNFWKEQWESAVARGDTQAAKQFEKNYKDTISNLNKVIEDAAKTIQDKYSNAIDKIFDALDKKISNGLGTDYLNDEWQLMNKNADEYLDTINSAFAIQQTERKYQQALNDAKNIKNQQALKTLMDEQLDILRNKEKITQYDIDRAEKLLQVEQARAALEDAQAAKTSMRLRRDTQGNYSYEYVADSSAIEDARGNLASAQNDLYNFDKDRYQSNLDDMLSAWKEFQSEYKDIITDTALSEQQRVEKMALLRDQYGEYINDKTAENMNIRNNLMESAFADLAALYDTDVANYNQMSIDEQNILMGELVPAWQSGIQQMANTVAGESGFIPTCEEAFESLEEQTLAYQESLEELADAAGINLQDIQDGVYDLADEFENLIEKNDDLLDRMTSQMFAIEALRAEAQSLVADYNNVYTAAAQAVTQLHDFVQAEKAAAAAYAQTAAAYESMVNRIQRANAAYAANPYGNYSYSGGNNSGSDSSGGGSSGNSGGTGSGSGSANKSANKTSNTTGYKSDSIVNGIMGGSYYKKYYYDTGGYTGNWNSSEGKLAVLHQKEQVFNEEDTSRLLNAVKILKNISESMNIDVFAKTSSLSHKNIFSNDSSDTLEQDVHIEATFPNVDSKREIEEALTGLVNAAAQRAMRR